MLVSVALFSRGSNIFMKYSKKTFYLTADPLEKRLVRRFTFAYIEMTVILQHSQKQKLLDFHSCV